MRHDGDLIINTKADAKKYAGVTEVTGYLYIRADAKLDALTSVGGDLYIDADAKLEALTSVGGCLYIDADAKLEALTSVGGYLSIRADAKLDAPALTSVGGYLSIDADAKLEALTSVGGGLYIRADAKLDAPALTSVGGYLYIDADAKLEALTSVGGCLYIDADAKLEALTSVGGYLYIRADAKLDALTSVGGDLSIRADAKLEALTSVGGYLHIYADAKLEAPALYTKGFSNFKVFDGIACAVMSTKERGGIEILSCRKAKIKNQRVVGDKIFVAKKGEVTAHAKDAKTALEELAFKLGDRDIEQYRNMPRTTRKAPNDWAFVYRMVTGACQYGTQSFMASKGKLKKTYTLAEIIEHTAGAYGHEKFRSIVCGKE